ncbi:MAG: serine/threonine-protein phosphatase [Candidatus Hydrogenedens sp.]|jgi:protein phosphatase|nr:serine/threonine-protein phosphatase [Candidatus Hydrogenedens sp.]
MFVDIGSGTHIGLKKAKNEDSFGIFDNINTDISLFHEGTLAAVADGLGGHIGGDIASKLAVSMLKDALKKDAPPDDDRGSEREDAYFLDTISEAILKANESIYQTNKEVIQGKRPMGTTLCAALIKSGVAYVGNVGDSRALLFRDGLFVRQTVDHSWVDEQVMKGLMSKEEAEKDKRRNLLTRSIGTHETIEVDTYQWYLRDNDQLLIATDGLLNMVCNEVSQEILARDLTAQEKVEILIEKALENGGKDNITLILITVNPKKSKLRRQRRKAWFRKHKKRIRFITLSFLFGSALFAAGYLCGFLHGSFSPPR